MAGDHVRSTMCCTVIDERLQHDHVFRETMHNNMVVTLLQVWHHHCLLKYCGWLQSV